jgi:hypothetical protein
MYRDEQKRQLIFYIQKCGMIDDFVEYPTVL